MAEPSDMVEKNVGLPVCRICFQCDDLIEPCDCQGTTSKVHKNCLEFSLMGLGSLRCEICSFHYKIEMVPKYQSCESFRVWAKGRLSMFDREDITWAILHFICVLVYTVTWFTFEDSEIFEKFEVWWIFVFFFYVIATTSCVIMSYLNWSLWKEGQMKISVIPKADIRNGVDYINALIEAEMNV